MMQHARERSKERYGIKYTTKIRNALIKRIKSGKYIEKGETKKGNRMRCTVKYDRVIYTLIYDFDEEEVVTILWHRGNPKSLSLRTAMNKHAALRRKTK